MIDTLVKYLALFVRGGLTPQAAANMLSQTHDPDLVAQALTRFLEQTGRIRTLREPLGLLDPVEVDAWYLGPQDDDKFWPALRAHWLAKGWDEEAVDGVDLASTKVVSLLQPSAAGSITTRGLVLGYVQSGKTANFTAVIAKAADVNYRLFIVLSGVTNVLRRQTQERLQSELEQLNREDWFSLTTLDQDFRVGGLNPNSFLTDKAHQKTLCVVKKNASVLTRLRNWLRRARPEVIASCPVLIIDDEADQASVNTSTAEQDRPAINRLIIEILQSLPKAAYVGYSATPFANFLIDPTQAADLYPRNFIVDLPKPKAYFGPERIFGREQLDWDEPDAAADGLDIVRTVPVEEVPFLHPETREARDGFVPAVTPSLEEALRYYLLATAARHHRGQAEKHSTMLIHTSLYSAVHFAFKQPLEQSLGGLAQRIAAGDPALAGELRGLWEREQHRVDAQEFGEAPVSFDELLPHLGAVLGQAEVKIENGVSDDRIDYGAPGRKYIVIGGNVLARGLTLEGLVVSYFIRTASAYDTLLQMGRWFGYRPGYGDLTRIWMSRELEQYFHDLATVEEEVRYDIKRYEAQNATPLHFGVRVRTHPALTITSRLKMQHAVPCALNYADSELQTLVFKHRDGGWLRGNQQSARELLARIQEEGIPLDAGKGRPYPMFYRVPSELVLGFLGSYQFHEKHLEMKPELLAGYIRAQNERGRLLYWNVGIASRQNSPYGTLDLGLPDPVPLISRAAHRRGTETAADVKALMSGGDVAADAEVSAEDMKSRVQLRRRREEQHPDTGMLLLYPIARDSRPKVETEIRHALDAVEHVVGAALVFPGTDEPTLQYVTVPMPDVEIEEPEYIDEEAP